MVNINVHRVPKPKPAVAASEELTQICTDTKPDENQVRAVTRASMHNPRYAFGNTTVEHGRFIVVAGGTLKPFTHTAECEFYDTMKNLWAMLPKLSEPKYTASIVNVKDQYVYAIGGMIFQEQINKHVMTVERINFAEYLLYAQTMHVTDYESHCASKAWEVMSVNFENTHVSDPVGQGFGFYDRLGDKIVIFGGIKIKFNEPLCLDMKTLQFKAVPQVLGMRAERFYYNNYTFVENGKKVIALGRNSVHEIDAANVADSKVIGTGYA